MLPVPREAVFDPGPSGSEPSRVRISCAHVREVGSVTAAPDRPRIASYPKTTPHLVRDSQLFVNDARPLLRE